MITPLPFILCRVACLNPAPYAGCGQTLTTKVRQTESGHEWPHKLRAKDQCISEEFTKNMYLQRELDKRKLERTRETWLLKNDLHNLEKANSKLQEQLKEQKKAHQGKPFLPSSTFVLQFILNSENYLHRRA
jgi:hypothetical protein